MSDLSLYTTVESAFGVVADEPHQDVVNAAACEMSPMLIRTNHLQMSLNKLTYST